MSRSAIAIYPGSFDPVTNGHLDIIQRGSSMTDKLIVSVAEDAAAKSPMFSIARRLELLKAEIEALNAKKLIHCEIEVRSFEGLLIHYAREVNAKMILRGLRAMTDFDYEFQMTGMNRRLDSEIETVFLMASEKNQFIASRMVKEVAGLGGDISGFVPSRVAKALQAEIAKK